MPRHWTAGRAVPAAAALHHLLARSAPARQPVCGAPSGAEGCEAPSGIRAGRHQLQAAGGFNIHLFPTGQGNIIGNPIEPVVKLTANPLTAKLMSEHVDCDVSKILSREMNLDQAGDKLIETTLKVANGRLTCAEALGHREFVMTKLYRSA